MLSPKLRCLEFTPSSNYKSGADGSAQQVGEPRDLPVSTSQALGI